MLRVRSDWVTWPLPNKAVLYSSLAEILPNSVPVLRIPEDLTELFPPTQNHSNYSVVLRNPQESPGILWVLQESVGDWEVLLVTFSLTQKKVWTFGIRSEMTSVTTIRLDALMSPTRSLLCVRTLRGRSLRHPSFVAAVHHSYIESTYSTISEVPSCKIVEAMLHVFTAQFMYSTIVVKTRIKPNFFVHIIVNAVSPHLNSKGRE